MLLPNTVSHSPIDHVTAALKSLHWLQLPVIQRIEFKLCQLFHYVVNGLAPININVLIKTTTSFSTELQNALPATGNNDLGIQQTKLKLAERAFSIDTPRIWNQLPKEIKAATETVAFKQKIKTVESTTSTPSLLCK